MHATISLAPATPGSKTSPTRNLSIRRTRWLPPLAPACAAATSGPTTKWNAATPGGRMGHEAIGLVEAVGPDVRTLKAGDLVIMPTAGGLGPPCGGNKRRRVPLHEPPAR